MCRPVRCDGGRAATAHYPTQQERIEMKLHDKVAIVTGAAQGIGLACAQRFVREGAKVVLADIAREAGAAAAAALGESASFFHADVSAKKDVESLIDDTLARHGRIDILLNNAGITHAAEFLELEEEDFDRVLRVNLKSMFLCGQAAARVMVRQGAGSIVNMSSVNAVLAIPNQVPYVISKGAINQLTKVMALNLAPHGRARRWAAAANPRKWRRSRSSWPATMHPI
jgi:glucose 1-dehydrogenase